MKIVQINATCGSGSTGKICVAISELLTENGVENYILYSMGNSSYAFGKKYMTVPEVKFQALKSRIFGNYGFQSKAATKRLINELNKISPDIVHLHNLHGHNVHLGMLLTYLKEKQIKIVWTFHDCWAFTGYCPHYTMAECSQWKVSGCKNCPQRKHYSWFFDRSRYLFEKKKAVMQDLDLTIVTPSEWLAKEVKQSFLKDYPVKVINNGIDLSVFCPRESNFREKYNIQDKFIVLGVAFDWGVRKGLDVFVELAKMIDDRFQIVLVGTNDETDKQLPENIISIHRTQNQQELAKIYTAADVFANPTREENFPTVNMESLACGTPIVTFNTGGSPEIIDETCGIVTEEKTAEFVMEGVIKIYEEKKYYSSYSLNRVKNFDKKDMYGNYLTMYSAL